MGTKAIDPQSIRNVTIIGDADGTARVVQRLRRCFGDTENAVHWSTDHIEHTIRVAALSSDALIADLERAIRVADGVIAVVNAAAHSTPRLETMLRVADDHQVARLCLVTGLGHPGADFDRCVRTIAETRGAAPLVLQVPVGAGADFDDVIDLVPMALSGSGGSHGEPVERWYRELVETLTDRDHTDSLALRDLHNRIRRRTRNGDVVPILCGTPLASDDIAPLLDAIVRYLPSPLYVCQPEHALDY
ncbi:GTP-binding protein [Nocardia salmonicida]|uniref:GTP-binding protein n=1 Tax=Nocardia salmonicida TaxID=53431 RepID=UPI002E2AA9F2|nr:GTP-binding protein [Nocardia salmonicida]